MVVVVCDELQVLEVSAGEIMSQQQKAKGASETRSEVQVGDLLMESVRRAG